MHCDIDNEQSNRRGEHWIADIVLRWSCEFMMLTRKRAAEARADQKNAVLIYCRSSVRSGFSQPADGHRRFLPPLVIVRR